MFINDSILMGVVSNSGGAGQGSEEVRKELGFWGKREWEVRKDGSGWGRGGNDGDGGFDNRWWEVFYWDVGKQDALDYFFELEVDIGILVLGSWGVLKLRAYDVSLLGSDVSKDMEKVGWGGDGGWGWQWGAVGVGAWGGAITSWAGVVLGVVRTIKIVLNDLVGSSNIDLVGVVDL
jgi:hypothetical protein